MNVKKTAALFEQSDHVIQARNVLPPGTSRPRPRPTSSVTKPGLQASLNTNAISLAYAASQNPVVRSEGPKLAKSAYNHRNDQSVHELKQLLESKFKVNPGVFAPPASNTSAEGVRNDFDDFGSVQWRSGSTSSTVTSNGAGSSSLAVPRVPQSTTRKKTPPPPRPSSGPKLDRANEAYAIVTFDYKAGEGDELDCRVGDRIVLKNKVNDDWYFGLNDRLHRVGLVPSAFLDIKVDVGQSSGGSTPSSNTSQLSPTSPPPVGPCCRAVYDYYSQQPGDLCFSVGEMIKLVKKINTEWFEGEISNRKGIFPSNFVTIVQDVPAVTSHQSMPILNSAVVPVKQTVRALFDYDGQTSDDLSFKTGDLIEVVEKISADWTKGRLRNRVGIFPSNFVENSTNTAKPIISQRNSVPVRRKSSDPSENVENGIAIALFDYQSNQNGDLSFEKGDKIEILNKVNSDWLKGRLMLGLSNQRACPVGIFPKSFVQFAESTKVDKNNNDSPGENNEASVMYDFEPLSKDELKLVTGEKVTVEGQINKEWFFGRNSSGRSGRFPVNYVKVKSNFENVL